MLNESFNVVRVLALVYRLYRMQCVGGENDGCTAVQSCSVRCTQKLSSPQSALCCRPEQSSPRLHLTFKQSHRTII